VVREDTYHGKENIKRKKLSLSLGSCPHETKEVKKRWSVKTPTTAKDTYLGKENIKRKKLSQKTFFTAKSAKFFRRDTQSLLSLRSLRVLPLRTLRLKPLLRQPLSYHSGLNRAQGYILPVDLSEFHLQVFDRNRCIAFEDDAQGVLALCHRFKPEYTRF